MSVLYSQTRGIYINLYYLFHCVVTSFSSGNLLYGRLTNKTSHHRPCNSSLFLIPVTIPVIPNIRRKRIFVRTAELMIFLLFLSYGIIYSGVILIVLLGVTAVTLPIRLNAEYFMFLVYNTVLP